MTWVGTINDYEHAEFIVAETEDSYFGILRIGPIVYELRAGSDGHAYIHEPDLSAYGIASACKGGLTAEDAPGRIRSLDGGMDRPTDAAPLSSGSTSVIDILLLYSNAAASNYDIEALANTSIASLNTSFDPGGINAVARIVHYSLVSSYTEATSINDDPELKNMLQQMRWGSGAFPNVPALRNTHSADLVMMLWDGSKAGNACGAGYIPSSFGGAEHRFAASTGDSCIAMFNNFTHEIGHNLGANHDYPHVLSAYSYSFGRSFAGDSSTPEFRTIMGTEHGCDINGCDRLNRWSDPGASYFSENLGVVGQSDNVSSHNLMRSVVANYRTPSGSIPGAMGTVTVTRGYCFSDNWIDWSPPSGVVGWYEVQIDDNGSFSSPSTFYRGVQNSLHLPVYSTTWVRARACNSLGCNNWQNGSTTATYTSGCL